MVNIIGIVADITNTVDILYQKIKNALEDTGEAIRDITRSRLSNNLALVSNTLAYEKQYNIVPIFLSKLSELPIVYNAITVLIMPLTIQTLGAILTIPAMDYEDYELTPEQELKLKDTEEAIRDITRSILSNNLALVSNTLAFEKQYNIFSILLSKLSEGAIVNAAVGSLTIFLTIRTLKTKIIPEQKLKQAINNNNLTAVKTLLLTLTSNTNNKDTQDKTPPHLAVEQNNPNIAITKELPNHKKIEPNVQDNHAKTPLFTKLKGSLASFCNSTLGKTLISILGISAIAITSKFIGNRYFPETTAKISDQISNVFGYFTTKSDHAKQVTAQITTQVTQAK